MTPDAFDLNFGPAWAREGDDSTRKIEKLAARHDRDEGDDRGRRGKGGKFRGKPGDRDRGPRKGGGRKFEKREEAPRHDEPKPISGWTVQFLPDKHGVDGLAKQIKSAAKAYSLFDLAQLVLEKSERYLVEFKRTADDAPPLFQLKTDGSVWTTEREAVTHALANHLEQFYRKESVEVEAPKGNFTSVAVCGMSGTILGPSNYHDYPAKVIRLHAERFPNLPIDVFRNRIRSVRDEETIEQWKKEQSTRDVYFPIEKSKEPAPESPMEAAPAAEDAPVAEQETQAGVPEEESAEELEVASSPEPVSEEPTPAEEAPEAEAAPEAGATEIPRFESLEEVADHFRQNHARKVVVPIRQRALVPGSPAMNSSSPAAHTLARQVWEELRRFPLPLAHVLGQQLTGRGLHLFKAHKKITYVSVARPKYLDRAASPVSEGLSGMLTYIEEHPEVPRKDQWLAMIALRPAPAEGEEDKREEAVSADLLWLLREGHVIDFARRGLEAARPPKPQPVKTSVPATESKVDSPATTETVVESPNEACAEASDNPAEAEDPTAES